MAVQLPDELIVEILSLLPAKSLLRCRSVCKSWLSSINSTKFKLKHLHNFNQLNSRYLVRRLDEGKELYSVHLEDEPLTIDGGTLLEFPFNGCRVRKGFRIAGCCNGVLCLSAAAAADDDLDRSSFKMIILWNPSIRRKLTLTAPSFYPIDFKDSFFVLGFGYNKMSDDYKVVCLAYVGLHRPHPVKVKVKVKVYTVKTGIWREVRYPDDLSCFFIFPDWSKVFFNGSVHWIAYDPTPGNLRSSIITFDTTTEIFEQIVLPDDLVKVSPSTMMITILGELLAVTYYKQPSSYKIWVMQEYKKPTSWIMIYNMNHPDIDLGKPLQLRNKGDMDMIIYSYSVYGSGMHKGNEYVYDFRTYVDKYQESLGLLDVGDSVPNEEAMEALMMMITE